MSEEKKQEDAKATEAPTENTEQSEPEIKAAEQAQDGAADAKPVETTAKKNYPGGERFDPSALPKSDDAAEIRKQVEFYFSDSNLSQDKFLFTMVDENDGWADLRCVANFKRMRRFQPFTAVVDALRESTFLDVDETGEKIKRKENLKPFGAGNSPLSRSIFAKGFPEETKTMQIDIEKYFEQFGAINLVRLRRTDEGLFKGSVFVEFAKAEDYTAFLEKAESDDKPKYGDQELIIKSKKLYVDEKAKEWAGKPSAPSSRRPFSAFSKHNNNDRGQNGRGRGEGGRGGSRGRGSRGRGRGRPDRESRPNDRNSEKRAAEAAEKEDKTEAETGDKRAAEASSDEPVKKARVEAEATTEST